MKDEQEKKELEMDAFETWEDPPYEIITPGAIEKARERLASGEWTPEDEERLTRFVKMLEEDMKRRGFRSNKENEQNR